jgi:bisphosphoglycerate-dependent phosphoglycerate mutase
MIGYTTGSCELMGHAERCQATDALLITAEGQTVKALIKVLESLISRRD